MAFYPLDRNIQNSDLWQDKPFAKGQAWIDLQMMANWGDGDMLVKGKPVHLERGQVFCSVNFLANRWGWSVKKVRHFLGQMEDTAEVTTKGTAQGTTITIENYPFSASEGQTKGTTEGQTEGQTEGTQTKKREKKVRKRFTPPTTEEVSLYCQEQGYRIDPERFVDFYTAKDWVIGKSKMRDWQAAVRNWARNEKKQIETRPEKWLDYEKEGI